MELDTVTLKDVLEEMDAGEIFSIAFVTCNTIKQTGGEWIFIKKACKHHAQFNDYNEELTTEKKYSRNPNHYKNGTRNIRTIPDGRIITVHIRLIRRFNLKTVM